MINAMKKINVNRKKFNKRQNSSICFMHGKAHLVNLSKTICIQRTGSYDEIMGSEVYTSAIANDISAIEDSASANENDSLAIKDAVSAIAIYIPAIEDDTSAIEINRYAIDKNGSAIKDDHFAIENNKSAIVNDTPACANYVFAGFGTKKTTYPKLKS
jgi:hypothetical protein